MKKLFVLIAFVALAVSCNNIEETVYNEELVLTGYSSMQTKTHFGTPNESQIPYFWSSGDYIWLGSVKSKAIAEDCLQAQFKWEPAPSTIGDFHLFYNMTGEHKTAKVLAQQSADGNLGNDGDFGYAVADEYGVFCLDHKTSYIWFDTKAAGELPKKLLSITITAAEGLALAGECEFDYKNNSWSTTVTNGTNKVVLDFGEGVELQASNEGVFAAMTLLPAAIANTELTVVYTFEDGYTFTETKNPSKNLEAGDTQRISTVISEEELAAPAPSYELRVLTFEDDDVKFGSMECLIWDNSVYGYDYKTITKWSDYIPADQQYGNGHGGYEWYDKNNTELAYRIDEDAMFQGYGGHAGISNYVGSDWENIGLGYYPQDLQAYNVTGGHSGTNFNTHFGYLDDSGYGMMSELVYFEFGDGEARTIDHMWVTNTTYVYNQMQMCNQFGVNYTIGDDSTFKIVAYGYESEDDTEPTTTEFYLLSTGKQIVTEWTKWDLSVLGKVVKVEFNMVGSEDMSGSYGLAIPAYFAYDDVAVRFEK